MDVTVIDSELLSTQQQISTLSHLKDNTKELYFIFFKSENNTDDLVHLVNTGFTELLTPEEVEKIKNLQEKVEKKSKSLDTNLTNLVKELEDYCRNLSDKKLEKWNKINLDYCLKIKSLGEFYEKYLEKINSI